MAYQVPTIIPIDANNNVAIGVSIPFNNQSVFNQTYTTQQQIKSNIINFVLTNKGERILNPNYGTEIRKYLFDNINPTTTSNIENLLMGELRTNFPMVNFQKITIIPDYDSNSINIGIEYYILNGDVNNINITL